MIWQSETILAWLDLLRAGAAQYVRLQPTAEYQSAGKDKYRADVIHVAVTVWQADKNENTRLRSVHIVSGVKREWN